MTHKNLSASRYTDKYEPYFWGEVDHEKFQKSLEENIHIMNNIYEIDEKCPGELISELVDSIQKIASVAGIRKKNAKQKAFSPPWYDTECNKKKMQIKRLGKELKKTKKH